MQVRTFSHVAIGVRDMDTSLAFYRDIVGLIVTFDDIEEFGGGNFPKSRRRGVYLRWSEDPAAPFLVLDQQLSQEPFGEPAQLFQVGLHHFGFWVEDCDAIAARARGAGLEPMVGPANADTITYGQQPGGTVRTMFLRDPDGNVVQFDQRVAEP